MFDIDKVDRITEMFIFDIYIAILKIKKVVSRFDNAQDLLYTFESWDSIIREFEIVGEASKYLLRDKVFSKKYQILVDFRNKITHEYFGINQDVAWLVANNNLDEIENLIIKLINDIEPKLKQELTDAFIEDNKYLDFVLEALKNIK